MSKLRLVAAVVLALVAVYVGAVVGSDWAWFAAAFAIILQWD